MFAIKHPSDDILASLWSEDLPAAASESILTHLDSCAECERRLANIDASIEQYSRIVKLIDRRLPDPPRPWANLRAEMERLDLPARPVSMRPGRARHCRPIWISAIAATIVLGLLIWPRGGSVVRAETLLVRAQASAGRAHPSNKTRLRVATGEASFVRPAVLAGDAAANEPLRSQFLTARYDWNNPLSAEAFRDWRGQLREKTDRLSESGDPVCYRLETATKTNTLRDASIVFQGSDLTPVSLRMEFEGGGWVEITAIPEGPASAPVLDHAPAKFSAAAESFVAERLLAERELNVRLAVAALSNNLPAPVTVETSREGNIIVTPYHLSLEQDLRLSESLAGKEGVLLNPNERGGGSARDAAPAGDEEPAIATAGIITSLAHLLAEDADRFPPARETMLELSAREALRDLKVRRTEQLIAQWENLTRQLAATHEVAETGDFPAESGEPMANLEALIQAAGAVNRLVTAIYTAGDDHVDAAVAWPELTRQIAEIRRQTILYQHHLKPLLEGRR